MVAARGLDGAFVHFGVVENTHRHHILDVSLAPARVPVAVANEAVTITREVMEALEYVGVLAVEFFLTRDERLLIPGVGFSVEPGVYVRGELGMRSEVNCYFGDGELIVTPGLVQRELLIV